MTFLRPRQIKTNYRPTEQTPASMEEMARANCSIEAVALFALAGTSEFRDDIIATRVNEFAALASELPDDMQNILVAQDEGLAIPKRSEWAQRWLGES